ncbi:uncharacterized protein FTOL_01724 [Fusarium torulosum]|uniref:F-box domain-containing protein n=1 Tax=Fusarium torulosum TaxID=33205 RepID=A0AAE8M0L0_9HYPO|nr:uncharacterized protein FTOL_01724 [Fusarium torulosum]
MSSNQWLEMLPSELHLRILSHLTPHDLSNLARTCQRFNNIVTPLIWDDIELHEEGYHESKHELDVPSPARDPARRPYHSRQPWGGGQGAEMKAMAFFTMLQTTHKQDFERFEHITKRIRHLCTVVEPSWQPRTEDYKIIDPEGIQVWQLLPYFSNLETLELYGNPDYHDENKEKAFEILGPTPRLRFAKLWGYMPRAVPAWLLRSGETLERLELGMLDRPISTSLTGNPEFTPLPSEKLNADAEGGDDESDWGSLDAENVIPRPLGGYLSSYHSDDLVFPKLKHLYLCQPSESSYFDDFNEYSWSIRAESACHDDWRRIMQSCVGTLETLVLEQRPAADYIEGDGESELEWMEGHTTSDACRALCDMTHGVLAADESLALKRIYFYGMSVSSSDNRLMSLLKERGVAREARLGQWCFFDKSPGVVYWCSWDAASDSENEEDDEDEEDEKMRWYSLLPID